MSRQRYDYRGSGPRAFRWATFWAALSVLLAVIDPNRFVVRVPWLSAFGLALSALGLAFLASGVIFMIRAVRAGRLETRGVYAMVRNPIYAAWILFLFPGLALATGVWMLLACSPLALAGFNRWVREEETRLEERFGNEYRSYMNRTPRLIPLTRPRP